MARFSFDTLYYASYFRLPHTPIICLERLRHGARRAQYTKYTSQHGLHHLHTPRTTTALTEHFKPRDKYHGCYQFVVYAKISSFYQYIQQNDPKCFKTSAE